MIHHDLASQLVPRQRAEEVATQTARKAVRVFVIGEQRLVRAALRALIETRPDFVVAGEADSCAEAASSADATSSSILLIDLPGSDLEPLADLPALLTTAAESRCVVITVTLDARSRTEVVRMGVMGLVTKAQSPELLFRAMETVHGQHAWIDRGTMTEVLRSLGPARPAATRSAAPELLAALTRREREIVTATIQGLKNRQVAERLFISETTVRHHLTSVFSKLGVHGRFELLRFAYQHGLAKRPDRERQRAD